ncbi:MAG: cupredoxin domain-containing protein [Deltaproteobacteria bacterium]|nr:cupredoxin domain-containing protein [Deltaproteobacteria bacterium]
MMLTKTTIALMLIMMNLTVYSPARAEAAESSQPLKITASKFHFMPDHITLVKGEPVRLQLTSTDATHGFMVRALKIDTDIKPGKATEVTVTPTTLGTFKAICDHYCGLGHSGMKMTIVVEEKAAASPAAEALAASKTLSR